eukprot:jgi/Mesvir1/5476/Mv15527-RA.1
MNIDSRLLAATPEEYLRLQQATKHVFAAVDRIFEIAQDVEKQIPDIYAISLAPDVTARTPTTPNARGRTSSTPRRKKNTKGKDPNSSDRKKSRSTERLGCHVRRRPVTLLPSMVETNRRLQKAESLNKAAVSELQSAYSIISEKEMEIQVLQQKGALEDMTQLLSISAPADASLRDSYFCDSPRESPSSPTAGTSWWKRWEGEAQQLRRSRTDAAPSLVRRRSSRLGHTADSPHSAGSGAAATAGLHELSDRIEYASINGSETPRGSLGLAISIPGAGDDGPLTPLSQMHTNGSFSPRPGGMGPGTPGAGTPRSPIGWQSLRGSGQLRINVNRSALKMPARVGSPHGGSPGGALWRARTASPRLGLGRSARRSPLASPLSSPLEDKLRQVADAGSPKWTAEDMNQLSSLLARSGWAPPPEDGAAPAPSGLSSSREAHLGSSGAIHSSREAPAAPGSVVYASRDTATSTSLGLGNALYGSRDVSIPASIGPQAAVYGSSNLGASSNLRASAVATEGGNSGAPEDRVAGLGSSLDSQGAEARGGTGPKASSGDLGGSTDLGGNGVRLTRGVNSGKVLATGDTLATGGGMAQASEGIAASGGWVGSGMGSGGRVDSGDGVSSRGMVSVPGFMAPSSSRVAAFPLNSSGPWDSSPPSSGVAAFPLNSSSPSGGVAAFLNSSITSIGAVRDSVRESSRESDRPNLGAALSGLSTSLQLAGAEMLLPRSMEADSLDLAGVRSELGDGRSEGRSEMGEGRSDSVARSATPDGRKESGMRSVNPDGRSVTLDSGIPKVILQSPGEVTRVARRSFEGSEIPPSEWARENLLGHAVVAGTDTGISNHTSSNGDAGRHDPEHWKPTSGVEADGREASGGGEAGGVASREEAVITGAGIAIPVPRGRLPERHPSGGSSLFWERQDLVRFSIDSGGMSVASVADSEDTAVAADLLSTTWSGASTPQGRGGGGMGAGVRRSSGEEPRVAP